jgi:hypothetical protein
MGQDVIPSLELVQLRQLSASSLISGRTPGNFGNYRKLPTQAELASKEHSSFTRRMF